MTTYTIKQARPSEDEIAKLWKLYHAADRIDTRFSGSLLPMVAEQLQRTELSREERLFILRAWDICIESGTFMRLFGAYDCWVYNCQDPALDYVDYSPAMKSMIEAGQLGEVFEEAYQQARTELQEWQERETALDAELLDVMRKYGWNVDRKNAANVLRLILQDLRAHQEVSKVCVRFLQDPQTMQFDRAASYALQQVRYERDNEESDEA